MDNQNNSPAPAPVLAPEPTPTPTTTPKNANVDKIKKLSIQVMIGGLIGAAVIAVTAVLAGSFNDTFAKALFTLLLVMLHSLASLAFVGQTAKSKNPTFKFFENVVFFLIVLSFFTSILGVWQVLGGAVISKLYGTYFIFLFASLHGQVISETRGKTSTIDNIVNANYVLMSLVILLILPVIWFSDADFPGFYYRLLSAFGIVDATLTILAVILHKLYIQKHPETKSNIFSVVAQVDANGNPVKVQSAEKSRHMSPLLWILCIFIGGQIVVSLLFAVMGAFYRR